MYLRRLELIDFRGYEKASVDFSPGASVLVGDNAQGKTNLLEAIAYLGVGASHRVSSDRALVRAGASSAVIRASACAEYGNDGGGASRELSVELELRPGTGNRARLNGQPQRRSADIIGRLRSVLFAPEDLELVRGDPAVRRRFLDDLLVQRKPAYLATRQEYERILRQRNSLLKEARRRGGVPDATLETWTDALIRSAALIVAARLAAVHALVGPTREAYRGLAGDEPRNRGSVELSYELSNGRQVAGSPAAGMPDPASLASELHDNLRAVAADERERGVTLVGPHRDELVLTLGELPAKGFASHGESWSLALALRLASRSVLCEVGQEPVVLLDDVFAELDRGRRERLAGRCASFRQVLVTAAVDEDVPLRAARFRVRSGRIEAAVVDPAPDSGQRR